MNKNESKYFNTARKMDEALIALLEQKSFEFITVKDICSMAEVNRSTFYLHYETIQDLLSETLEYLNSKFSSYFRETEDEVISCIPNMPLEELILLREKYLVPYLRHIRQNRKVFALSYQQKQTMHAAERYEDLCHHIITPILNRFQVPEELGNYYNAFFMHGTLAVIQEWLKNDCKEEPETISRIVESLVLEEKQIF